MGLLLLMMLKSMVRAGRNHNWNSLLSPKGKCKKEQMNDVILIK